MDEIIVKKGKYKDMEMTQWGSSNQEVGLIYEINDMTISSIDIIMLFWILFTCNIFFLRFL